MHDHSRFQRDIDDVTGISLSLYYYYYYYSQKSLTHNIGSASALPIIMMINDRRLKGVAPENSGSMAGIPIPQVTSHKHLGVIFNDTLKWSNHIDKVYKTCCQKVRILGR